MQRKFSGFFLVVLAFAAIFMQSTSRVLAKSTFEIIGPHMVVTGEENEWYVELSDGFPTVKNVLWDWGDKTPPDKGPNMLDAKHTYATLLAHNYLISVTITDENGNEYVNYFRVGVLNIVNMAVGLLLTWGAVYVGVPWALGALALRCR